MRATLERAIELTGMAAAAALLAGCHTGELPRLYGGQYQQSHRTVIHASDPQALEVRNPYPDELKILEPVETRWNLFTEVRRPTDTSIHVPPGGSHRLPFVVETVVDERAGIVTGDDDVTVRSSYLREDVLYRKAEVYEHKAYYLIQDGPTVRLRVQRGNAEPQVLTLSLYGCPGASWADAKAPQAVHRVSPDQAILDLPQALCPAPTPKRG